MKEKFIFRYYTPADPFGRTISRVSIVGVHEEEMLKISVSRCSKDDMFSRQKGRFIAEKRLQEGKLFAMFPVKECHISNFILYAQAVEKLVAEHARLLETKTE